MSQLSKLRQSRDQWKRKAQTRADDNRYLRKHLARVKQERDRHRQAVKEADARQPQQASQGHGMGVEHKADLVFLALTLFVVARLGFRAVSRVLSIFVKALGIRKAPCPQTIINWVTRLSMVRLQSAAHLEGATLSTAPFANGLIWMIDISIGLGTGKMLAVLALDAGHHQRHPGAPTLQSVRCIAVSVSASWNGETIAELLQRIIAVTGRPVAYLKDGGGDLKKAVRLLDERGLASPAIDDISHVVANLLKRHYQDHPLLATFLSACGKVSGRLKQTILACLVPPCPAKRVL